MSNNTQGNAPSVEGLEVVAYGIFYDNKLLHRPVAHNEEEVAAELSLYIRLLERQRVVVDSLVRHSDAARLIAERDARIAELDRHKEKS